MLPKSDMHRTVYLVCNQTAVLEGPKEFISSLGRDSMDLVVRLPRVPLAASRCAAPWAAHMSSLRDSGGLMKSPALRDDMCEAGDLEMVLRSGRVTSPGKDLASPP